MGREISEIIHAQHTLWGTGFGMALAGGTDGETSGMSLTLREGEILGIAGLIGAGRTEALRACFGLDRVQSGAVLVRSKEGDTIARRRSGWPAEALLSENRKAGRPDAQSQSRG